MGTTASKSISSYPYIALNYIPCLEYKHDDPLGKLLPSAEGRIISSVRNVPDEEGRTPRSKFSSTGGEKCSECAHKCINEKSLCSICCKLLNSGCRSSSIFQVSHCVPFPYVGGSKIMP